MPTINANKAQQRVKEHAENISVFFQPSLYHWLTFTLRAVKDVR
jgi:hypothetical protein